jgi:hypothetical protein
MSRMAHTGAAVLWEPAKKRPGPRRSAATRARFPTNHTMHATGWALGKRFKLSIQIRAKLRAHAVEHGLGRGDLLFEMPVDHPAASREVNPGRAILVISSLRKCLQNSGRNRARG